MAFEFACRTCGGIHRGLPAFGPDEPLAYAVLSEKERQAFAALGTDNCEIDGKWFFVRGRLEIAILGLDEFFVWLVWCSLSKENYDVWVGAFHKKKERIWAPFSVGSIRCFRATPKP